MATPLMLWTAAVAGAAAASRAPSSFDWSSIAPSSTLNYTACYDGFKCARLEVPLDWLDTDNPARVTIAIAALPAVVAEDDPTFGGTIFTNPGGPSGSGVNFLLGNGRGLQAMTDSASKKFEILSFDPRGVGETLPRSDCWQDEVARQAYETEELAMGSPDHAHVAPRRYARSQGFGRLCKQSGGGGGEDDIRNFMSTSSVARDMVEIVDKIDELRKLQDKTAEDEDGKPSLELRKDPDVPRLNYLGFSYGTVLGNYFASMFPGRVGHVALEAVCDVHDYYNGTWSRNLQDTPHIYQHFWDTCFAAGDKCALYTSEDGSPGDIRSRFEAWMDELEAAPAIFVSGSAVHDITPYNVLLALVRPLYSPMQMFPKTAEILFEAMQGNYSGVLHASAANGFSNTCPPKLPTAYTWTHDAMTAIACGDAVSQTDVTLPEFQDYLRLLRNQDPRLGPFWSRIRGSCLGWHYRPKYAFSGPWETPEHDSRGVPGRPLAPLLFVSSKYDPVTPLRNAREMSKNHPGSGVLIQDNAGHGTGITPGKCRDEAIKRFFDNGEVPDGELYCEADCVPFQECESAGVADVTEAGWLPRAPLEMMW